jgi:hypothetical protein
MGNPQKGGRGRQQITQDVPPNRNNCGSPGELLYFLQRWLNHKDKKAMNATSRSRLSPRSGVEASGDKRRTDPGG